MVQYPIDDARALIADKLQRATQSHADASDDLDFLRDQTTVVEVNVARLHNHSVLERRRLKE